MAEAMKLWQITDELDEIGALIAEAGGELSPELEERLDATEEALKAKVESVALFIRDREMQAKNAKEEKDRLAAIQKAHENTVAGLKTYLLRCMSTAGVEKVETHRARVRRQRSGTPSIDYHGEVDALHEDFVRVIPEKRLIDKKAITQAIRDGEDPPEGCVVSYSHFVRIY